MAEKAISVEWYSRQSASALGIFSNRLHSIFPHARGPRVKHIFVTSKFMDGLMRFRLSGRLFISPAVPPPPPPGTAASISCSR